MDSHRPPASAQSGPMPPAPAPHPAFVVVCETDADLCRLAGRLAGAGPLLVADLSLGSWRGHWLARELGRQLGLDLPGDQGPVPGEAAGGPPAERVVAALIDRETMGDATVLAAHHAAVAIADAARRQGVGAILIAGPAADHGWMAEDLWLLRLLNRLSELTVAVAVPAEGPVSADELAPAELPIAVIAAVGPVAPTVAQPADPDCPGLIWPGLIRPEDLPDAAPGSNWPVLPAIAGLAGAALILPGARAAAAAGCTEVPANPPLWQRARTEALKPVADRRPEILSAGAAAAFAEGGWRQSLRLIEAALPATADAETRGALEAQAQAMRIAVMDFAGAADRPDPEPGLSAPLRRELATAKAWGLVMTGRPAEADRLFGEARALATPADRDPMWLYLLNISALAKLRTGRIDDAFAFEHQIEARLRGFDPPDWHLGYINAINLARLHRQAGQIPEARACYERAFAITLGLRSESDQLYLAVCQAGLEQAEGRIAEALITTLRAALHWLSMTVPEALAPRVARAMGAVPGGELVARVDDHLLGRLTALLEMIGPPFDDLARNPAEDGPRWRRAEGIASGCTAWGGPGWGVLIRPRPVEEDQPGRAEAGRDGGRLGALTARILSRLSPAPMAPADACILVDGGFGTDMPVRLPELIGLALRQGCARLRFRDRDLVLTAAQAADLLDRCRIGPGPGIDAIDRAADGRLAVRFRRVRPQLVVAADDPAAMALTATDGLVFADLQARTGLDRPVLLAAVRRLEACGALAVSMPDGI
ncbi:tetratricopeptide repeat protein [Tistrella mobilis]|uniref:tetratricopeptide repeat protein n=1 Tax=Tistrella mobilis TaxID=171437 RepID=UPI00355853F2